MANLSIKTSLFPFRLSLRDKRAAELAIEIKNNGEQAVLLSFDLWLPDVVAFDKSGLNKGIQKRIDSVKPGETKVFRYPIFATNRAEPGVFSSKLVVSEHAANYDYVTANYYKEVSFRIID